jgi:hypothetical protein
MRRLGVSRSALGACFNRLLGESTTHYLGC